MNAFSIGVSALAAGRRALDLVGQNISNATTTGYTRQAPNFVSVTYDGRNGVGVDIATITRYDSPPLRSAILRGNSDQAFSSARVDTRRQVEIVLRSGPAGISSGLDNFFNQVEALTNRPDDIAVRQPLIAAATELSGRFRQASIDLDNLRNDLRVQINQNVSDLNRFAKQIAEFNVRIAQLEAGGAQANDLKDQRGVIIDELSKRVDIRTVDQPNGVINVIATGAAVVVGQFPNQFTTVNNADGTIDIRTTDSPLPLRVAGGRLSGLLSEFNVNLPATRGRLDTLARQIIKQVNLVQASGLGVDGPFTQVRGLQSVADPNAPLSTQNLPIPLQSGNLVISVTDTATGTRSNATIAIDPATQSLNDLAAAITSATGGNVQGVVDPTNNSLRFDAQPGFALDFAGRVPNPPDAVAMGGTSTPVVGGVYSGNSNDVYTFSISGSGTIGVTPGLSLQVRDSSNNVIATLNIGSGYAAGTPLLVGNGVTVNLAPGTTSNGTFSVPLVAYPPDTAGALPGLGLGGLFEGTDAFSIGVRREIQDNPGLLAASRSGFSGDSSNLRELVKVRDTAYFTSGTFADESTDIAVAVGTEVRTLTDRQTATESIVKNLFAEEQGIAGVDINEEMVHLLDYQRMVDSASRYMSVVNTAIDSILNIIK